ncbi:HBL/NHE enterotoxin family protein [Bacillus sp. SCS-151]|uniref:HBL/NHE enterotoxin family protein n=1 Tax=Nanhaiella sioensis TaxID=3115293 RepID=UPI00397AF21F
MKISKMAITATALATILSSQAFTANVAAASPETAESANVSVASIELSARNIYNYVDIIGKIAPLNSSHISDLTVHMERASETAKLFPSELYPEINRNLQDTISFSDKFNVYTEKIRDVISNKDIETAIQGLELLKIDLENVRSSTEESIYITKDYREKLEEDLNNFKQDKIVAEAYDEDNVATTLDYYISAMEYGYDGISYLTDDFALLNNNITSIVDDIDSILNNTEYLSIFGNAQLDKIQKEWNSALVLAQELQISIQATVYQS